MNPAAVAAMAERGISLEGAVPKQLTEVGVREADVVVTMGCGDVCPFFPGKTYEDWALADPAGQGLETVRGIRDEIERRVDALLARIAPA